MASDAALWCFFDGRLNKRFSKQSRRQWLEMPSGALCCRCNQLIPWQLLLWLQKEQWHHQIWFLIKFDQNILVSPDSLMYLIYVVISALNYILPYFTVVVAKFICSSIWLISWWRHQMKTFSALLAICAGNSPFSGEFPTQRPLTPSFDVFLDLRLNKRLSKQPWGWWFETLSWSLWRQCNISNICHNICN